MSDNSDFARNFISDLLREHTPTAKPAAAGETAVTRAAPKTRKTSLAETLVRIATESCELWHTSDDQAFASVGRRSFPVGSKSFRLWLVGEFRRQTEGRTPGREAIASAIEATTAAAIFDGPEYKLNVRVADGGGGAIYLCLGDELDSVLVVDSRGWRACENPPVKFVRPPSMLPLPVPSRGGTLGELKELLNVPDGGAWSLIVAWLCQAVLPVGPYPLLVLTGEQGSAKSTTARILKALIDPAKAPVRSEPREERDLMIAASSGHLLCFDNVSRLPGWLSDSLCRLSTGGGFATRELYTDANEVIFDAQRPIIVNGIEDFVSRGDLLERSIVIRHPPIPEGRRRTEAEIWGRFRDRHPRILGALLDRVSAGIKAFAETRLERLPRMADFAKWAAACERGAGEPRGFLAAYLSNQTEAHEQALEASPLVEPLRALLAGRGFWEGTAGELLAALDREAPVPRPRDWPTKPNVLAGHLRRIATDLRRVHGITISAHRRHGGRRVVRITTPTTGGISSSPIVTTNKNPEKQGAHGDDRVTMG